MSKITKIPRTWVESEVINSLAIREISGTALRIYLLFLLKRQFGWKPDRKGVKQFEMRNNGELIFTYGEAEKDHGIKPSAFREGRDKLIEVGLLDITFSGAGLYKSENLYALSQRWQNYGCPNFVRVIRPKDVSKGCRRKRLDGNH
jgi:hypothetical protein